MPSTLQQLTGPGVFTQGAINAINANFAAIQGIDLWVRPQYGNNNGNGSSKYPLGSYFNAFASVGGALSSPLCVPGTVIGLLGVTFEEVTGPIVNDITIVGMGNQPRQATTSGVANGGGATWMSSSATASTPLLIVQGQGWRLQNIFFASGAGVTANPCVQLLREGDPPTAADGSHAQILNCVFTGTDDGLQAKGGVAFVTIDGCTFFNFAGSGDTGISNATGLGVGTNYGWTIRNSVFRDNVNSVLIPLINASIYNNNFEVKGSFVTDTTIALSLTGGARNSVFNNMFNRPTNTSPNATLFVGGTNDVWSNNYGSDAIFFGVPDNS